MNSALKYPFGAGFAPKPGELFEVCDGVHWLNMPLPISMDYINLWLLEDGDQWVIVDSGMNSPESQTLWRDVFRRYGLDGKISKVIVTHLHPDHVGLAAWLCEWQRCPLLISEREYHAAQDLIEYCQTHDLGFIREQCISLGYEQAIYESFIAVYSIFSKSMLPLPKDYQRISAGEALRIGGRDWQLVGGNGHSPEHICLYQEESQVFIAGDQILPEMIPHISVVPPKLAANPLKYWLQSCEALGQRFNSEVLVLPSHQAPFYGIPLRMQQILNEHQRRLEIVLETCQLPSTVKQVMEAVYPEAKSPLQVAFAASETMAHINYWQDRGVVSASKNAQGVYVFSG